MSTTEQKARAIELAKYLEQFGRNYLDHEIADFLRRLSAENEALQTAYEALTAEAFARSTRLATVESENEALRARESGLIKALADCRDVFQMPDPGAELELIWGQAMGDPESVPGYVKAQVDALRAQVEALTNGREAIAEAAVVAANARKGLDGLSEFLTEAPSPLTKPQEPFAWAREWDGDVSDFGNYVVVFNEDEKDDQPGWAPLYTHPTPSPLTRPAVPEGWKLVPVEATIDMCHHADGEATINFEEAAEAGALSFPEYRAIWRAMLASVKEPNESR